MSDPLTPRFDDIVYPTDGSSSAERAQWHATYLATHYRATLHVLHVETRTGVWDPALRIDEEDLRGNLVGLYDEWDADGAATSSETSMHGAHASRTGAVDSNGDAEDAPLRTVRRIVAAGSPERGILRYARSVNAGLIVMGTSGRRGLERIRQGSVTESVVNEADCPVLTVGHVSVDADPDALQRILVPLTFEPHDVLQVARARMIAHAYNAGVDLLHVVTDTTLPTGDRIDLPGDSPHLQREAHRRLEQIAAQLKSDDVDVLTHVREGQPAQEVIRFARHYDMDLVILTTQGRTTLGRRLLGSVAEKIVRHAPCPVLSLRLDGRRAAELLKRIEEEEGTDFE